MEQEESQEMRISLLHSSIDDDAPPPPHTSLIAYLYAGHFLGRWGARMWEFSFGLFMIDVWPDSQLFAAIYGAVESASTALFGSVIGQWVDRFTYFKVLRAWLLAQNLSFIVAGGTVTTLLIYHALKSSGFIAFMSLVVLTNVSGATGVLATLAGTILIEREWVVVISSGQPPETLTKMNSVIRRFDLICKLFAPVFAGFIISFVSLKASAITLAIWNTVSGNPALSESNQMRSMTAVLDDSLSSSSDEKEATSLMPEGNNSGIEENDQKLKTAERILRLPCMDAWVVYLKQDVVLPGLLWNGKWGFLLVCVASIWIRESYVSVWMLMGGVAASRLGLWMFDLAVIQQMQDHVLETDRCVVGGVQNSLQAMLDLMTYILGTFISDPKDFGTLEMVSFILVTLSALLYSLHVYKVRKHLFHFDKLFLKISTLIQQL
ncbi:hypothetical protein ACLOJK_005203 [Asimina triloba]